MAVAMEKDSLLDQLLYSTDQSGKIPIDDGIARLYKEIQEVWNGELLPANQYGLKEAWEIISSAEKMDVAFAVRTNLTFNGFHDDDSPIHGKAVTFRARDCLHVKAKYNEDWWIGRVVKVDAPIGFIPAPAKLKKLAEEATSQMGIIKKGGGKDDKKLKPPDQQLENTENMGSIESLATIPQTRVSEIETRAQGPYEGVPVIRPIILCGPSMRGFEITDLMHKALIHALKRQFEDRLEVYPVEDRDLKELHSSITSNKYNVNPDGLDKITDNIYREAKRFKLMFVDLKINSPVPLKNSAMGPILVHIKISNSKVLTNLIKQRGADQKRGLTAQLYAATKLCDLDRRQFDVVLNEHDFDDAAEHLINYLEKYWRASRPLQASKRHNDSFLRNTPAIMSRLGLKSPKAHYNSARRQDNRIKV